MLRLNTLAHQIAVIALTEAPATLEVRPYGEPIVIEFEKAGIGGHVWDSVRINGNHAGNRWGGVREFIKLVEAARPQLVFDDDGEPACQIESAKPGP